MPRIPRFLVLVGLVAILSWPAPPGSAQAPAAEPAAPAPSVEERIDDLLARMTLEEKVGQLTQWRGRGSETGPKVPEGGEDEIRRGESGSFLGVYGAAYTREMQRIALEESRLGIPLLFAHDCFHPDSPEFLETPGMDRLAAGGAHGVWDTQELFDLLTDPQERHNLIDLPEHRERADAMRERLFDRLEATGGMRIPLRRGSWQVNDRLEPGGHR